MNSITVEAPDDVLIIRIALAGDVASGQELVALQSPKLEQQSSRLVALGEHLSFLERPFNDGRIDEEIAALGQKAGLLSDALKLQIQMRPSIVDSVAVGQLTPNDLAECDIKIIQAQNAQIDAALSSSHAERKKTDLQDKITLAKNKIARDKVYLDEMRDSLTISLKVNGVFHPNAVAGTFVRKGHILGRIDL